jgi:hypothetical protein
MYNRLTPDLVVSPNGFGFRSNTGEVYRLNATARQILGWMEEGEDETRIAQRLADQHQIPLQRVRHDLAAFFENLRSLQLLQADANK